MFGNTEWGMMASSPTTGVASNYASYSNLVSARNVTIVDSAQGIRHEDTSAPSAYQTGMEQRDAQWKHPDRHAKTTKEAKAVDAAENDPWQRNQCMRSQRHE